MWDDVAVRYAPEEEKHLHTATQRTSEEQLVIRGGIPLHGTVEVSGSKNASLPIMAASILAHGPVTLNGVPHLRDVSTMVQTLRCLGLAARHHASGQLDLETVDPNCGTAPGRLVSQMRASFCVLGPLLATRGRAVVALPGGCAIGSRPVNLHLRGLAALGAEFRVNNGYVIARANHLRGTKIDLLGPRGPTVTGTANVLCAATLATGTTVIEGAAREPEIVELGQFLCAMGANIEGLGTRRITIEGVKRLSGTSYTLPGDRIEACTYLLAAAITGGDIRVDGVDSEDVIHVLDVLHKAGHAIIMQDRSVRLIASPDSRPIHTTAEPYPAVPTDVQPLLAACTTLARGRSTITDGVFPERFSHVAQLARMGARIHRNGPTVTVDGPSFLEGAVVRAFDLRGGAALVLAALAAAGETVIRGVGHLDRGYEHLQGKLSGVGANIQRIRSTESRTNSGSHEEIESFGSQQFEAPQAALSVAARRA